MAEILHKAHGSASQWTERIPKRHPCEVTADRLLADLERYPDAFDGAARDEVGHIRHILHCIADGVSPDGD